MTDTPRWVQALWDELDEMPPEQQFVTTGEWITFMTQSMLPDLGIRRRENVLELLSREGVTLTDVSDQLSVRRQTVSRLAEEGKSTKRQRPRLPETAAA